MRYRTKQELLHLQANPGMVSRRRLLQGAAVLASGVTAAGAFHLQSNTPATAAQGDETPDDTGRPIEPAAHEGGLLIQGGDDIANTNPILDPFSVLGELVFEELVNMRSGSWELEPTLAESWEVSDDGLTWTITLREGVTWHDGQPLTSEDVVFSFTGGHMNPDTGANETSFFNERIASIEALNEREVAFTTVSPTVHFLDDYIQYYPILPEHIWGAIPPAEWMSHPGTTGADPALVVGTGPFKFKEWAPGDHLTLVRNDDYWGGAPHLDEYIYKVTTDTGATTSALLAGEIDLTLFVDPASLDALPEDQFQIFPSTGRYVSTIRLNHDPERTTLFTDPRVRQAMLLAVDRQALIDAADFGYAAVPTSWMMPGYWALDPAGVSSSYGFDPEEAGRLLDEAGWTVGADGVREKDGQRFSFPLYVISGSDRELVRAQLVQEYWRAVGIETEITVEEAAIFDERWWNLDFEAMLSLTYIGPTVEHGFIWECDGEYSTGYCNPRVDELFEQGRALSDRNERIPIYTEIQDILMRELPLLPLALRDDIHVVNNRVHNVHDDFSYFFAETWWVDP